MGGGPNEEKQKQKNESETELIIFRIRGDEIGETKGLGGRKIPTFMFAGLSHRYVPGKRSKHNPMLSVLLLVFVVAAVVVVYSCGHKSGSTILLLYVYHGTYMLAMN